MHCAAQWCNYPVPSNPNDRYGNQRAADNGDLILQITKRTMPKFPASATIADAHISTFHTWNVIKTAKISAYNSAHRYPNKTCFR